MKSKQTLADLEPDDIAIVQEFRSTGKAHRRFREMGLMPGCLFTLVRRAPLGDPIEISIMGALLSIRGEDAQHIIVKKVEDEKEAKPSQS